MSVILAVKGICGTYGHHRNCEDMEHINVSSRHLEHVDKLLITEWGRSDSSLHLIICHLLISEQQIRYLTI